MARSVGRSQSGTPSLPTRSAPRSKPRSDAVELEDAAITAMLEQAAEVEKVRQAERPAELFFVAGLTAIAGGTGQLRTGDSPFDFLISVPADCLHEVSLRVADLELQVQEKFNVSITAMPIPIAA